MKYERLESVIINEMTLMFNQQEKSLHSYKSNIIEVASTNIYIVAFKLMIKFKAHKESDTTPTLKLGVAYLHEIQIVMWPF